MSPQIENPRKSEDFVGCFHANDDIDQSIYIYILLVSLAERERRASGRGQRRYRTTVTVTGMARLAQPLAASMLLSSVSSLMLTPAWAVATPRATPSRS